MHHLHFTDREPLGIIILGSRSLHTARCTSEICLIDSLICQLTKVKLLDHYILHIYYASQYV